MNLNSKLISFRNLSEKNVWEWEMPCRKDTMYLSTIKEKDVGGNKYEGTTHVLNLVTSDINNKKNPFMTRKSSSLFTSDIEKCFSKKHFKFVKYPFDRFSNLDIEGSKSGIFKFKTKRCPSNPLTPIYSLPKIKKMENIKLKFIKDPLELDDIIGTRTKKSISDKFLKRTNFIGDIQKPDKKKLFLNKIENKFDGQQIRNNEKFRTTRCIDPLTPVYTIKANPGNSDYHKINIGPIEKNTPKLLHKELKKQNFSLQTFDIKGAQSCTSNNPIFKKEVS